MPEQNEKTAIFCNPQISNIYDRFGLLPENRRILKLECIS